MAWDDFEQLCLFKPNTNEKEFAIMRDTLAEYNPDKPCFAFANESNCANVLFLNNADSDNSFSSAWRVEDLLNAVAKCDVSCFIDCGALVAGFSSLSVAKYFMTLNSSQFPEFRWGWESSVAGERVNK